MDCTEETEELTPTLEIEELETRFEMQTLSVTAGTPLPDKCGYGCWYYK